MLGDTIAAVSTPRGRGGVALLRVSGPEALQICEGVFFPKNRKKLSEQAPRTAVFGSICLREANGSLTSVDEGLATVFCAPASFTGEDTVEICCHGGILLTETVLSALLAAGARPAEAGEFTRRAFLNGKLGLSAAEALGELLEAQTRAQLLLAHGGMRGAVGAKCQDIYAELRRILASVYVTIDYPDEDLAEMSREELTDALQGCLLEVERLCRGYATGHAVAEGIRTVICGKPNVGKSSLFNRLLGREAAIVTDIEGTTRDLLTETAALGKVTLRLCDTAGIHSSRDRVEQIGIARAKEELEQAELILAMFDASRAPDEEDRAMCRLLEKQNGTVIALLNKCDLGTREIPSLYRQSFAACMHLSAETGEGMEALQAKVEQLFTDGTLDLGQDAVLTNARQFAAASRAQTALQNANRALCEQLPFDICCSCVEEAMEALCEIDGRAVSEDLVSEIFSHFCVGK